MPEKLWWRRALSACPVCGAEVVQVMANITAYGGVRSCSKDCRRVMLRDRINELHGGVPRTQSPEAVAKRKATNLAKYGAETPLGSAVVKAKVAATNLQRYGVENVFADRQVQERLRETNLRKYGVTSPLQNEEIKARTKQTVRARYGVDNPLQSTELRDRGRTTCLQRYGADNPQRSKEIRAKTKATCLVRYGTSTALSNTAVSKRMRVANKAKYGVEYPAQRPEVMQKALQTRIARYGTANAWAIANRQGNTKQAKVRAYLRDLGFDFKETVLPGCDWELDGFSDDAKAAFEFNGLYWHCDAVKGNSGKDYHFKKTCGCRNHGIRLFSIFEDEWDNRQEQVKSFLRAALGKNSRRISGRKCEVRKIDDKTAQAFYNQYHTQGRTMKGHHSAGLYADEELVGCMSFGDHPHRREDKRMVLTRLCFKTDVSVIGGSAKLFKFLLQQSGAQEVISWSDNRWSEGGVYKALGFALDKELPPDYQYVEIANAKKRMAKQRQRRTVTDCPEELTELQWATTRGLSRIWDCGKIRWKWVVGS